MANNTKNHKTINLPKINKQEKEAIILPFNGVHAKRAGFSFSFSCFDRTHKLFNLGDVPSEWYIDLLDCLKSINNMTFEQAKRSLHDLHPVDWSSSNTSVPKGTEQCEYWQFRISKSKGRVIGCVVDETFYIVWLDPHHNLTDSEGYGTITYHKAGMSI